VNGQESRVSRRSRGGDLSRGKRTAPVRVCLPLGRTGPECCLTRWKCNVMACTRQRRVRCARAYTQASRGVHAVVVSMCVVHTHMASQAYIRRRRGTADWSRSGVSEEVVCVAV